MERASPPMPDRYAIMVRWVFRDRRYVATSKRFPAAIAHGPTREAAMDNMVIAIARHVASKEKIS